LTAYFRRAKGRKGRGDLQILAAKKTKDFRGGKEESARKVYGNEKREIAFRPRKRRRLFEGGAAEKLPESGGESFYFVRLFASSRAENEPAPGKKKFYGSMREVYGRIESVKGF
jgi:hypothetical protein